MSTPAPRTTPGGRSPTLRTLVWCAGGLLLAAAALLLVEPSTSLYLAVARTGVTWPESLAGASIIALSVSLVLVMWRPGRFNPVPIATGLTAGAGVVIAYGLSEALKLLVVQDRPCRTVLLHPGCPAPGSWSFPSNHTTIAFALATAIVLVAGRWWAWSAYLVALTAAASRVVDGVHFPHDVLAGAVLGMSITVASTVLLDQRALALIERRR